MINTIPNSELMSYRDAFVFLQDKFDTLRAEVEYWLNNDCVGLIHYDVQGNVHLRDNSIAYVDRKSIETCDFAKDHPYWQRVPSNEIEGNLIPRPSAITIIKNKLKGTKYVGHKYTIFHLLSTLRGFTKNIPNKHGDLFIMKSPAAAILSLYYEENEVNNLNILNPEYSYIDFNILMERLKWKGLDEDAVCLNLIHKCNNGELKAIGSDRYVPCAMDAPEGYTLNPYGKKEFYKIDSPTGHYGYDATALIGSKQSLFQLSEIIAIEKSEFPATGGEFEEKEPAKKSACNVGQLMEIVYKQLKIDPKMPQITQKVFANRIYKQGLKQGVYLPIDEKDPAKKKAKEDSIIATITRKLSTYGYAEKKKSLSNSR